MANWFTKLFGAVEEDVKIVATIVEKSLDDRQADANALASRAVSLFDRIVTDLETSAERLKVVATEAEELAAKHKAQAEAAIESAVQNLNRAAKIKDLLS